MEYTGNLLTGFEKSAEDIISQALENAKHEYGYYKAHIKGYYELKNNAPESELYDILSYARNKDNSLSAFLDNSLFFKYFEKNSVAFIKKDTFKAICPFENAEQVKMPEGFVKLKITNDRLSEFFNNVIDETIKNYFPSHNFGCCSKFNICSDLKHCIHKDLFYAKGCMYRKNLEQGIIFYGKSSIENTSGSTVRQNKGKNLNFFPDDYTIVDLETTGGSF